jgi:hypothetical protein
MYESYLFFINDEAHVIMACPFIQSNRRGAPLGPLSSQFVNAEYSGVRRIHLYASSNSSSLFFSIRSISYYGSTM